MKILPGFFLAVFLLSGCSSNNDLSNEKNLMGTWRLYDAEELKTAAADGDPFARTAQLKQLVTEGQALSFFSNDSYSDIKGEGIYSTGNWHFSAKDTSLSFTVAGKVTAPVRLKIEKNAAGKLVLNLSIPDKNLLLKYVKESEPLKEFMGDPFYTSNNQWRIKPVQAEDTAQLNKRLANYFKHLALILKSAQERKQNVVSFEFSQGPAKIYSGGIGIHPYQIVPETWKKCFYDEADAGKAYINYEKYLQTSRYHGAGTGDWITDDYNILLAIYSGISQQKD